MEADVIQRLNKDTLMACVLLGLIGLVGVIGNIILLRSLIRYKNLRIDMYVLMGGLALADLTYLALVVPSSIIDFVEALEVNTVAWCKASEYMKNAMSYVVAYHLVCLAVLRGILLTNRGHSGPTSKHTLFCSCLLWVFCPLFAVPVLVILQPVPATERPDIILFCNSGDETLLWLTSMFSCFVPIFLLICIYIVTGFIAKRYFSDSYSRHERLKSRLVTVIIVAFCVCQVPYYVLDLHLMYAFKNYDFSMNIDMLLVVRDYFLCLSVADKAVRPVLYSKLAPHLDDCFDEVINCTMCSRYYTSTRRRRRRRRQKLTSECSQSSRAPLTSPTAPTAITNLPNEEV